MGDIIDNTEHPEKGEWKMKESLKFFDGEKELNDAIQNLFNTAEKGSIFANLPSVTFQRYIQKISPLEKRRFKQTLKAKLATPEDFKYEVLRFIHENIWDTFQVSDTTTLWVVGTQTKESETENQYQVQILMKGIRKKEANANAEEANANAEKAKKQVNIDDILIEKDRLFLETKQKQKALLAKHPQLKQQSQEHYQQIKTALSTHGILQKLTAQGYDDQKIEDYISFAATQELLKQPTIPQDKETQSFLFSFEALNKELNIPNTSGQNLLKDTATPPVFFHSSLGNDSLISDLETSKKNHQGEYEKLFPPQVLDKLAYIYGNLSPKALEKYQKEIQPKLQRNEKLTPADEQWKTEFYNHLLTIKNTIDEKTKTTLEQMNTLWPVIWLAGYLNMPIGNDFLFNTSRGITLKDEMITIKGSIYGNDFAIRSDLSQPSFLQTSDYLTKINKNTFSVGEENFQNTKYVLPGREQIWDTLKATLEKQPEKVRKNVEEIEQYQEELSKNFREAIQELYGYQDLLQVGLEQQMHQIHKNLTSQKVINLFQTLWGTDFQVKDYLATEKGASAEWLKLLNRQDNYLERASTSDVIRYGQAMEKLMEVIAKVKSGKNPHHSPILQYFCSAQAINNTENVLKGKGNPEPNLIQFMDWIMEGEGENKEDFSTESIVLIEEFHYLLEENMLDAPKTERYPHLQTKRNDFRAKQQKEKNDEVTANDKGNADEYLLYSFKEKTEIWEISST